MQWIAFRDWPSVPSEGRYLLASTNMPYNKKVLPETMWLAPGSRLEDIDAYAHGRRPFMMMLDPEQHVTHFSLLTPPD